jgi:hypothetical protein
MTNVKGYLVERDNRSLFIRDINEASWALEDSEYTVTALIPVDIYKCYENVIEIQPQTDDTAERMQLMNELFDLQQQEIDQLKQQLEKFVEVVEGIVELTEVISQSSIENRSKLLVISESCKQVLKPSE